MLLKTSGQISFSIILFADCAQDSAEADLWLTLSDPRHNQCTRLWRLFHTKTSFLDTCTVKE